MIKRQYFDVVDELEKFSAGGGRIWQIFAIAAEFAEEPGLIESIETIAICGDVQISYGGESFEQFKACDGWHGRFFLLLVK